MPIVPRAAHYTKNVLSSVHALCDSIFGEAYGLSGRHPWRRYGLRLVTSDFKCQQMGVQRKSQCDGRRKARKDNVLWEHKIVLCPSIQVKVLWAKIPC